MRQWVTVILLAILARPGRRQLSLDNLLLPLSRWSATPGAPFELVTFAGLVNQGLRRFLLADYYHLFQVS